MKIFESGKLWPYAIGLAITGVFCLGVWTIMETDKADIHLSDDYMSKYQNIDENINKFIKEKIKFNKKYKLDFETKQLKMNGCDIRYKVTTIDGKSVPNATMVLQIDRPGVHLYTQVLKNSVYENGEYIFKNVKFPKVGRWDLMLKVQVGELSRFYNIKADTRDKIGIKIENNKNSEEGSLY